MPKTMTRTYQMVHIAVLSTLSFLLMYLQFPLLPSASFLQLDFSILPMLIGLVMLDVRGALMILVLRTLLKLLLNNGGVANLIGLPMNVIALAIFIVALALIWNHKPSLKRYLLASMIGTIGLTLAMLLMNYLYAIPLYATLAHFDIASLLGLGHYLVAMVIPFNLIEGAIFSFSFFILYHYLQNYLRNH